jgi:hypothetical protein
MFALTSALRVFGLEDALTGVMAADPEVCIDGGGMDGGGEPGGKLMSTSLADRCLLGIGLRSAFPPVDLTADCCVRGMCNM